MWLEPLVRSGRNLLGHPRQAIVPTNLPHPPGAAPSPRRDEQLDNLVVGCSPRVSIRGPKTLDHGGVGREHADFKLILETYYAQNDDARLLEEAGKINFGLNVSSKLRQPRLPSTRRSFQSSHSSESSFPIQTDR